MQQLIESLPLSPSAGRILAVIIGTGLIWMIIRTVKQFLLSRIKDNDTRYRTKKLSGFVGFFLTVILILFIYGSKLGGWGVAFGVAGAGIAFALQEVIASFAGWLAILFGGFYKSGDRVQLGGIKGDVMDIGVLRTTLMETGQWVDGDLYNGRIVLVANSFVFKEPVYNYSGEFPFLWDEIKIPVQHGSDYRLVEEILVRISKELIGDLPERSLHKWDALQKKYRLENAQTDPMVSLVANEGNVEFTLRYIVDYKRRRTTKTELFTGILREFEATGGRIRFASATLQLVDPLEIRAHIAP